MPDKIAIAEVNMIKNLEEKTGKSFTQWLKIASAAKIEKHKELVTFLQKEYDLGYGYANLIVHRLKSEATGGGGEEDLVSMQYAGEKATLKPIYDELISVVSKFGSDVEISPKKANVSLRRNKQFALIQPTTKTRIDVGINLKGTKPEGRLEASGSFSAMVSHRVRVESAKNVNKELIAWLKAAYDAA